MCEFKFLADMAVSLAAIEILRQKGIDIVRTLEVGFRQNEDDLVLLDYATTQGRIMITCDRDFEWYGFDWQAQGKPHASILYLNMSTGDCQNVGLIVYWVELICGASDPESETLNQIWRAK